jgi:hypothetical protein
MCQIERLSQLIREKNLINNKIAAITGRPALTGHTGEYIASVIFDIQLEKSAISSGYDGKFTKGILTGKTVNVKWYLKNERLLDIRTDCLPDYYLVLAGPYEPSETSRNSIRPWIIKNVYLFNAMEIIKQLKNRGVKIGTGTSILGKYWDAAEIYPVQTNTTLYVSEKQKEMLKLFEG